MKARTLLLSIGTFFIPIIIHTTESNFIIHHTQENDQAFGYLFAHGLGATQEQARLWLPYNSRKWIINKPLVLFDFPDSKNNSMEYHNAYVNLGQDLDIQRLKESFEKALAHFQDGIKFIGGGISRGGVTLINYVAEYQPTSIAALVLESPFDTLMNVIKHLLRRFYVNWIPGARKIALKLAKKNFPLLNLKGIFPIDVIHKIPNSIPIFIAHSQRDKTIPINCSRNLYKSLLMAGHKNTYILELASGDHGKLINGIEGELYANVLHAFYKKYNLPYNPQCAQAGGSMLKYCQPTLDEINQKIRRTKCGNDFLEENDFLDDNWGDAIDPTLSSMVKAIIPLC